MMMQRLLWKGKISIEPLVLAILVGIAAFNLLVALIVPRFSAADAFVSVWILMPNLVALGAPALLIGTEEESKVIDANFEPRDFQLTCRRHICFNVGKRISRCGIAGASIRSRERFS